MIQCSRGVLKTLLNLKKERGRYHLRFILRFELLRYIKNHTKEDGLLKNKRKFKSSRISKFNSSFYYLTVDPEQEQGD